MGSERRGRAVHGRLEVNPSGEEPTDRPRQKNAELWEPYDGRLSRTVLRERVKGRFPPATHQARKSRACNGFSNNETDLAHQRLYLRLSLLRSWRNRRFNRVPALA